MTTLASSDTARRTRPAPRPGHRSGGVLTGVGPLLKVALRQNLRSIAPWVVAIAALSASSILAYRLVFPEVADRMGLAVALGANPALDLIFGHPGDLLRDLGLGAGDLHHELSGTGGIVERIESGLISGRLLLLRARGRGKRRRQWQRQQCRRRQKAKCLACCVHVNHLLEFATPCGGQRPPHEKRNCDRGLVCQSRTRNS